MKFAVFCISGLCDQILAKIRLAALDSIAYHDISSTIPVAPITSWTSAWSSVGPAVHGKFKGARGKKSKVDNIWDTLERQGYDITLHEEGDWMGVKGDIHIYRLDSMVDFLLSEDLSRAQESLNDLAEVISKVDVPYLVISALGVCEYSVSLNIDNLLVLRQFMQMGERGEVLYDKTYAYPADYTGSKPRPTYGIFLNTIMRDNGFMEHSEAMDIEAELMSQLNQVDDVQAISAHQVYDIGGQHYDELPDIVFRSEGHTCFLNTGIANTDIVSSYRHYGLSSTGMIASNHESLIQGINTVTDIREAIMRGVKAIG